AEEAGTDVTVHNPGAAIPLGSSTLEISTVENEVEEIEDGAGGFVMTSYWEPVLPDTDAELHTQLYAIGPIIEAAGLSVNNTSPEVATQQGSGALPGYSIS